MGLRPRDPSPPEASCARPPVRHRRVQLWPAPPVCQTPPKPRGVRYPLAVLELRPTGPASLSPTFATATRMPSSRPGSASEPRPRTGRSPRSPTSWPPSPHACGGGPDGIDQGVRAAGRHAAADRPDRHRPALLLRKASGGGCGTGRAGVGSQAHDRPQFYDPPHDHTGQTNPNAYERTNLRQHQPPCDRAPRRRSHPTTSHPMTAARPPVKAAGQPRNTHPRTSTTDSPHYRHQPKRSHLVFEDGAEVPSGGVVGVPSGGGEEGAHGQAFPFSW
ncbi:hypothetical protein YUWDRAFT_06596 [Streptomyces sp. AmelKG-D3]|nr:hypothetical protein YUWDRAFT_06596 [Streptomyces sp. AmelKG-D3]